MYAVIRTGGKQYRVEKGDILEVERLDGDAGDALAFDEVLLIGDETSTEVGKPLVAGAVVTATLVNQTRARKVLIFKMKRRKTYRRKRGHRQMLTRVRIVSVDQRQATPPPLPAAVG